MTALIEHLGTGTTTVCRAWVIRRLDGVVYGFTDHDLPLLVDGVTCRASAGMAAGALQRSTGLSVDNSEAVGALSHDAITAEDLRAGRWDGAEVTIWMVNWAMPEQAEIQFRGLLGEITSEGGEFSVELRGLAERLNHVRGRVYQPRCDAVFGDTRCGVDAAREIYSVEVEVVASEDSRALTFAALEIYEHRWFERGLLDVLSGAAAGLSERIKTDRAQEGGRVVELWAGLRADIAPGDRVRLTAGCDKRSETCRFKFNNFENFRGFPHIPGDDWLMSYPTSGGQNDGSKL